MFTLNVKLKNASDVSNFKELVANYDSKTSMVIGGRVVAKPMITCSPYITPLNDITVMFNSDSINEFMNMVRDLGQYITEKQDNYTKIIINKVHHMTEE